VLRAETAASNGDSSVARVIDGSLHGYSTTAIAGVSNVGDDVNWTGSHFNQANWYVFGRMAWDPDAGAEAIAEEWVRQTFSNDPAVVVPVTELMMQSRQAAVDYMTPLGLVHIMGTDHHYGPAPWVENLDRAEWNPVYYHKADMHGLGFDRTATGSNAVEQYHEPVRDLFSSRDTVPDDFLLFFHHVGWNETLGSGRTLWEELVHRYSVGVDSVADMRDAWNEVQPWIDEARFTEVADYLEIQHYEARWWRDACLTYFQQFSGADIPDGYAAPANPLDFYRGLEDQCPADRKKPRCTPVYTGEPSPAVTSAP
jgi:alpha-glucuronidase